MGYPIYKLLRAVNRQYPNNGFINNVDVREDMYDSEDEEKDKLIDEDLRDLINETLQEVYIHVAKDEVYSFPTVPGQKEYVLPDDCDLRDIQEVTRAFRGIRRPLIPPNPGMNPTYKVTFYSNGGTGTMEPMGAELGETITLPECTFVAPEEYTFGYWDIGGRAYNPGDEVSMYADLVAVPVWLGDTYTVTFSINPLVGNIDGQSTKTYTVPRGEKLSSLPTPTMLDGYTFSGWAKDGIVMPDSVILDTPITENVLFDGKSSIDNHTLTIYIQTKYGKGILHHGLIGQAVRTTIMEYGGTPYSFSVEAGDSVADIYATLEMHDMDDNFLASFTSITPTEDMQIPVAVPVVEPTNESPGSNGDGGYTPNPDIDDTILPG